MGKEGRMAKLNLDYYSGDNQYSDGDIEEEILRIASNGLSLDELEKAEFPVLYHLSPVRENILNWYPFRQDACCLEIGSGCGAISGLLCRKMKKVVSVELSKRRADINFARHGHLDNLEIMVGNLNDMQFSQSFDYIVLNGVFEYAMSFTEGENPYREFLSYVAGFLKPDGILLVAIENRLGLKYFAGAPEDHTNAYMDGLRGYPENLSVRTFSKEEWKELLGDCGLGYYRFYYPYPDYKFPCEIFTDETLKSQKYGRKTWNFTEERFELFPEQEMAAAFCKEGIMDRFANSFLIEMSNRPILREKEVLYAKLNMDRHREFAICTTIECARGQMEAVKKPLTEEAQEHIERMARTLRQESGAAKGQAGAFCLLPGRQDQEGIHYPWMAGKSLGYQAEQAILKKDASAVKRMVSHVFEQLIEPAIIQADYGTAEFCRVFGEARLVQERTDCLCPANVDLILDNIFPDGEQNYIIDGEWIFDFPIPSSFVIWRTINELYANCPWFEKQLARASFMGEYGITSDMEEVFWSWATHFAEEYVGANSLAAYAVPEVGVRLEEIRTRRLEERYLDSTLYIDTGKGFSEEESLKVRTELRRGGSLKLEFDLQSFREVKALRFDPLEGRPCLCRIVAPEARLIPENASGKEGDKDLFLTTDPSYRVELKGMKPEKLRIEGTVDVMEKDWALQRYAALSQTGRHRLKFW